MKKILIPAAVAGAFAAAPACLADTNPAVSSNTTFGAAMFQQVGVNKNAGKNLFFSPYSIFSAMTMVAQGARGPTADEMGYALQYPTPMIKALPSPGNVYNLPAVRDGLTALNRDLNGAAGQPRPFDLNVANALWIENTFPINPDYAQSIQQSFDTAGLFPLDFANNAEAGRAQINAWVENLTHDKIKDLVPAGAVDKNTKLVLTNAIYFKAAWQFPFDKDATANQPFHLDAAHDVQAPLMRSGRDMAAVPYLENDDFQAIALPYKGADRQPPVASMLILLPKKIAGLADVEKKITADNLSQWSAAMQRKPVQVFLPKFKMTGSFDLSNSLQNMGMKLAFTPQADFTGICSNSQGRGLCISQVLHKAYIDVNEDGTEAAAATAVVMMRAAVARPGSPIVFRADHPFLVLIRHEPTGAILFMGRLNNPAQ